MSYRFVDSFRAGPGWNVKFVNAKQAKEINQCRNTKEKIYNTDVALWYNKICREKQLKEFHPDPAQKLSTNLYDVYHC
jgi:hypothetical protein